MMGTMLRLCRQVCDGKVLRGRGPYKWGIVRIAAGMVILAGSSLYLDATGACRSAILLVPDMVIFILFGSIASLLAHSGDGRARRHVTIPPGATALSFAGDICAFTGFFSIVLFPLSGLGVIEWGLVSSMLLAGLAIRKNPYVLRFIWPWPILVTAGMLYCIKVTVEDLFLPDMYSVISGSNPLVRWIVCSISGIVGATYLVALWRTARKVVPSEAAHAEPAAVSLGVVRVLFIGGAFVAGGVALMVFANVTSHAVWELLESSVRFFTTPERHALLLSQPLFLYKTPALLLFVLYVVAL